MPRTIRWHEHVNSSYPMVHSAAEELLYEARKQGAVFTVPEEIEIANDKRRQKQHLPQQEHPLTGYSVADAAEEYEWSGGRLLMRPRRWLIPTFLRRERKLS